MIDIYVNGHGYANPFKKCKLPYKLVTYVTLGAMFDGRETHHSMQGKKYPHRATADTKFEVTQDHSKNRELEEHYLVTTKDTFTKDIAINGKELWSARPRIGVCSTRFEGGTLHRIKSRVLLYVTHYDKIVKLSTLVRELKDFSGPHQMTIHWTACRSVLPSSDHYDPIRFTQMCLEDFRNEGDTGL